MSTCASLCQGCGPVAAERGLVSLGWQGAIRAKIAPQPLVAVVLTHPLSPLGGQSHVEDPGS